MKAILLMTILLGYAHSSFGQETIPLYQESVPNSKETPDEEFSEHRYGHAVIGKISRPTLTIFRASPHNTNRTAVIIFPGGGYSVNAIEHEGHEVAKALHAVGITAFVVKYRIPNEGTMINREMVPLQDAQQAIYLVRKQAKEWGIDPMRIGVMGFSAGGHLASSLGTHYDQVLLPETSGISLRPDFMMLIYPVISFQTDVAHLGSREQLIGKNPSQEKIDYFSSELHVNTKTPPTFLVHASDDSAVKPDNSILFYQALLRHQVPAELHLYQSGQHGFGLNNTSTSDQWLDRAIHWMKANNYLQNVK